MQEWLTIRKSINNIMNASVNNQQDQLIDA